MTFKTQKKTSKFQVGKCTIYFFKVPNTNINTKQIYSDTLINKTISKYVQVYFRNSKRNFARN